MTVDEMFALAMQHLAPEQREELSDMLFKSSLPEVPGEEICEAEWEESWLPELARRCEAIDRGVVQTRDAYEALDEMRRKLREERRRCL